MTLTEAEITAEKQAAIAVDAPPVDQTVGGAVAQGNEHAALYEQFGLDSQPAPRVDEILTKIWDYAKTVAPGSDRDSIIFEVIRLKNRLGSPSMGETPWAKVHNYVNVWRQFRESGERLKELENGKS